jgi:hypothetical protein
MVLSQEEELLMATTDCPGYNPANNDKLHAKCWAEHEDGSMIFIKDIDENDRVIYELFDFSDPAHPLAYPHALSMEDFKKTFSSDHKKKKTNITWLWHDRTGFPWDRVMASITRPVPAPANVIDTISAAARMADSLNTRLREHLTEDKLLQARGLSVREAGTPSKRIIDRLRNALDALVH